MGGRAFLALVLPALLVLAAHKTADAGPVALGDDSRPLNVSLWAAVGASDSAESRDDSPGAALAPIRPADEYALPTGFFHSPTGTLLRSVAFPGWGQWSNGKKQKAAIYFAIESYFITKAMIWRHRARASGIDFPTFDRARDRRNYFYWLTGMTIFVSMFDAYGDRYLLTLERTRDAPDEYWGGRRDGRAAMIDTTPASGWRIVLTVRF